MSKKNIHIKKYLNSNLPEPEIQADDAWAKMDDMLSVNPVPETQISTISKLKFLINVGLGIITSIGIVTAIWFLVPEEKSKNIVKQDGKTSVNNSTPAQSIPKNSQKKLESIVKGEKADRLEYSRNLKPEVTKAGAEDRENFRLKNDTLNSSRGLTSTNPAFRDKEQNHSEAGKRIVQGVTEVSRSSVSRSINPDFEADRNIFTKLRKNSRRKEKVENNELIREHSSFQPYYSGNNEEKRAEGIRTNEKSRVTFSTERLFPNPIHFNNLFLKKINRITYNQPVKHKKTKYPKEKKPFFETLHAGLEWNAASSFNTTKYIFRGTDSTSKPYLLLIPGIWISKDISEKQLVRLSFYANQPYYGGSGRVQRFGSDSALFHNNINLIKATGINIALQYEYRLLPKITASGGLSYSPLRKALTQDDYENYQGIIIPGPKLILNKQNISQYMHTNLFMLKTGLTFSPGHYQLGANILIPVSNLSLTPTSSLRTLNGQFFFRYTIK